MAMGIAQRIIKEDVNNQIVFNIIDLQDPKEIWNKLKSICIKVGQGVVYLIFQKLLYYLKITKPKEYKRLVMQIFEEAIYLYICFYLAMTPRNDLWNIIVIVIALDLLYKDFDITNASLLETGNKIVDQIQSIL